LSKTLSNSVEVTSNNDIGVFGGKLAILDRSGVGNLPGGVFEFL